MDNAARNAAPLLATLMLVPLGVTPLQIPSYGMIAPALPLMGIYYWAVHRPDLLPFSAVFLIGVLQDVLTGAPMGANAFILLLCCWFVSDRRRFLAGRSFLVLWWGFIMLVAFATVAEWVLSSVHAATFLPMQPGAFRALMTIALFPVVSWFMIQVHRGFLSAA